MSQSTSLTISRTPEPPNPLSGFAPGALPPSWDCQSAPPISQRTSRGNTLKSRLTVGTVYERSHIPLHKWSLATHLMASSKKGISAHQLHRSLGITYKSAWFMAHRIREAMDVKGTEPMGGAGKTVEADETFIGTKANHTKGQGTSHKMAVVTLAERNGRAKSFKVDKVTAKQVVPRYHRHLSRHPRSDQRRGHRGQGSTPSHQGIACDASTEVIKI